jgi:hypothetical protein
MRKSEARFRFHSILISFGGNPTELRLVNEFKIENQKPSNEGKNIKDNSGGYCVFCQEP